MTLDFCDLTDRPIASHRVNCRRPLRLLPSTELSLETSTGSKDYLIVREQVYKMEGGGEGCGPAGRRGLLAKLSL